MVCVCVSLVGEELLQQEGGFLAMDWQNDPRHAHHVKISQKEVLVSVVCLLVNLSVS